MVGLEGERQAHAKIHKENIKNELPASGTERKQQRQLPETRREVGSDPDPTIQSQRGALHVK